MKSLGLLTTVLLASAWTLSADTAEEKKERFRNEFRNVPLPELPAHAAAWVRRAPAHERSEAAKIALETVAERHPGAAESVRSEIAKTAPETHLGPRGSERNKQDQEQSRGHSRAENERANPNRGSGQGDGHANGGVGHGVNKPGKIVIHPHPVKDTLPNGKPRHHPKDRPNKPPKPEKPDKPDRPHKYNKPKHH